MHTPYGLAMIEKIALDTNVSRLERIRYEAKIQGAINKTYTIDDIQVRSWGFLNRIITALSAVRDRIQGSARPDYNLEIDCEHALTPCS